MNILFPVSRIKNRALRRVVIVLTYPLTVLFAVAVAFLWNATLDVIHFQIGLARSAREQWK